MGRNKQSIRIAAASLISFSLACSWILTTHAGAALSPIRGEVRDPNGDYVAGIKVVLIDATRKSMETLTDDRGRFVFPVAAKGGYTLSIVAPGFAEFSKEIELRDDGAPDLRITLRPTVKESVTVSEDNHSVSLDPQSAAGSQVLSAKDLSSLPDDPDDFENQLQLLATSSGSAPGQATFTVDGYNVSGRLPPKSAIREIRINPDLFSAEYDKAPYQGGRVQIFTRPGSESFNGTAFFNYSNSVFNAREAFAPTRADANIERYGFQFGGPIIPKKVGFLFDFEGRNINEVSTVNAIILSPAFQPEPFATSVAAPKKLFLGSGRVDWQVTQSTALIFRIDFDRSDLTNLGVGGFNLPERGFDTIQSDISFRVSATSAVNKALYNEFRFGFTRVRLDENAVGTGPALDVLGSFSAGGSIAQGQQTHQGVFDIADNLSLIKGAHSLKMGVQFFHRGISDVRRTGFNGDFIFGGGVAPALDGSGNIILGGSGPVLTEISGLEQYRRALLGLPGGQATQFTISRGDPRARIGQLRLAEFGQDEVRLKPNLSISLGLRIESQTNPTDVARFAPRLGIAYSPDKKKQWVLRARAGIFYDRISETVPLEDIHSSEAGAEQLIVNSPSFPDAVGGSGFAATPSFRILAADLQPVTSFQTQVGFERQLPRGWKVQMNYSWSSAWHLLRTLNVNAPIPTAGLPASEWPRPFGVNSNMLQFNSEGAARGSVLFVGANQSVNKYFNLFSGYLLFDFHSNTESLLGLPQNSFNPGADWARPIWQSRHRAFVVGIFNMPWRLRSSVTLNAASGTPFNITTGEDNNGDGVFSDRPSFAASGQSGAVATPFGLLNPSSVNGTLPRNAGTNPPTFTMDANLSRTFSLGAPAGGRRDSRYQVNLSVRASNLLNHTNVTALNGVLLSPFFDRANSAGPARRIEFGLRFNF